ncbi:MAG TPA: histidine phosphatase family protein [Thermomicrobiales bacterium]
MTAPASRSFYLVRHCRATGQAPDAPLTPEGMAQAGLLADLLAPRGIARILSSPFVRARDSIAPLAAWLGIAVETDDRLIERVLTTEPLPDWRLHLARSFDDDDYCLAGGESSRAATARAAAVMEEARQHPAPATVIVTHGNLLALLLRHCDGRDGFAAWEALTNPDAYCVIFEEPPQPIVRLWTLTK